LYVKIMNRQITMAIIIALASSVAVAGIATFAIQAHATSIVGGKGGTGGKGDSLSKPNGGGASSKNTGTSAAKSNGGGS
jgi:hypothetical protein